MNYGIKVSKPGKNVKTCPDKDLVFSSEWNTFKIIKVQSFEHTIIHSYSPENHWTVAHNLGYRPMTFLFYWETNKPEYVYLAGGNNIFIGENILAEGERCCYAVDDNNLILDFLGREIEDVAMSFKAFYTIERQN